MNLRTTVARTAAIALTLLLFPLAQGRGADSPFEIDIRELDRNKPAPRAVTKKPSPPARKAAHREASPAKTADAGAPATGYVRYRVRAGDHIFRILMREFGMSNNEAERLIPEIQRINDIADIRKLTVGRTLLIPTAKRKAATRPVEPPAPPQRPLIVAKTEVTAVPTPTAAVPAPEAPKTPPAATVKLPPVSIRTITAKEPEEILDAFLAALSIKADKNRIIEPAVGKNGGSAFSVKVDRYFEDGGMRFIMNCTDKDSFTYTLLRLLEVEGYRVLQLNRDDDLRRIGTRLLTQMNRPFSYVAHRLPTGDGDREIPGFLVTGREPDGSQVLVTAVPLDTAPAGQPATDQAGGK